MHPKIGIIICGFNENRQFVPNVYIQSVRYAKGIPLLIPLVRSDRMIDDYVSLCDGFLFCGGEDITPLLFGEEPQNGNGKTDITVDLFQIRLMKRVLASRKPVLAICRGMQILNVSCGGTIWQDLSLIPQPTLNHTQQSASRGDVSHRIKIELSGHPFALGVQWHPECMYRTSPEMRSLFHEFIAHSLINSKDSGHTIS